MAVKLKTKKVAKKSNALESLIDEVAELHASLKAEDVKLKPMRTKLKEREALLEKKLAAKIPPEEEGDAHGVRYSAHMAKQKETRAISNLTKAKEFLGEVTFMKLASIKLGDIDKYLTPDEQAECIEKKRSGKRAITFTSRG
jgi:hypothetical protein